MFRSQVTASVMLVCGSLFLCVSEFLSGSEAWVYYPSALGIGALIFLVLVKRKKRREEETDGKQNRRNGKQR